MSPAFFVAAALGGFLRYLAEFLLPPISSSAFPRATLVVNCAGSFVLGLVSSAGTDLKLIVGVGFCGALTTMSGVNLQVYRRLAAGARTDAMKYLGLSVLLCTAVAALGHALSGALFN